MGPWLNASSWETGQELRNAWNESDRAGGTLDQEQQVYLDTHTHTHTYTHMSNREHASNGGLS